MERAVVVTRGKSLDPPLGELRKTNTIELPRSDQREISQSAGDTTNSRSDRISVVDEYKRKQRDEIIWALTTCKGRAGGADGAATPLGITSPTSVLRMSTL